MQQGNLQLCMHQEKHATRRLLTMTLMQHSSSGAILEFSMHTAELQKTCYLLLFMHQVGHNSLPQVIHAIVCSLVVLDLAVNIPPPVTMAHESTSQCWACVARGQLSIHPPMVPLQFAGAMDCNPADLVLANRHRIVHLVRWQGICRATHWLSASISTELLQSTCNHASS